MENQRIHSEMENQDLSAMSLKNVISSDLTEIN